MSMYTVRESQISALRALLAAQGQMLHRWAETDDEGRNALWKSLHDRAEDVWLSWDNILSRPWNDILFGEEPNDQ